jgi:hypothetical protein
MVDHPKLPSRELESFLALPADEAWDVGQPYRPSRSLPEQHYQFSRWAIRAVAASLEGLPEAIRELTNRIQGVEQRFLLLPSATTVSLTLFVTETDTVIGMGINAEAIRLLARINAGIEISLVVTQA